MGTLPVPAEQLAMGTVIVHQPAALVASGVALYAQVSGQDQKRALWQNSWVKERPTDEAAAKKSTKAIVGPAARGNAASASGLPASRLVRDIESCYAT